jgi:hypothetical protein
LVRLVRAPVVAPADGSSIQREHTDWIVMITYYLLIRKINSECINDGHACYIYVPCVRRVLNVFLPVLSP